MGSKSVIKQAPLSIAQSYFWGDAFGKQSGSIQEP